jgi:hypothetical protein
MSTQDVPSDILKRAKAIPAWVLKKEVGRTGRKEELIKELFKSDPAKTEGLADYYELKSEQSLFLFRVLKESKIDLSDLVAARKRINALLEKERTGDDPKLEVLRISPFKAGGRIILQVRYQKEKHTDKEWDGVVHTHRDTKSATIGLNTAEDYAIVHTRSGKKALTCMKKLASILFGDADAVELVVPSVSEQEKKFGKVKPKFVAIDDLKLPGAKQLTLRGQDVRRTLKVLRDDYELDLEAMGGTLRFGGTETQKLVRFGPDGRLIFPSRKLNQDALIKKVLE